MLFYTSSNAGECQGECGDEAGGAGEAGRSGLEVSQSASSIGRPAAVDGRVVGGGRLGGARKTDKEIKSCVS
ncbi:hypothetical protein E2C01_099309 [Portunus trituberculatus]|uniref:Uncharacterized protein n=1 Tax=Portunus trituberculatus TaxID=210409 RepID=A0A5B7KAH2_PORTR|nr:hypothetical protein [Portunus trituberculatus]